ncbi:undecaprenyl-diphosphate phosphatase [Candidatus Pacearchaeota archaeon]|nr:undecaprenyl-diphosphate phosphatase [Candidatus Pacearchaeota archaeon]
MIFLEVLVYALIQGLLEWFPVSSSGHLTMVQMFLKSEPGVLFFVALHFGTLMAVFVYFGKDLVDIMREMVSLRFNTENGKLGLYLLIGAIPAVIAGGLIYTFMEKISDTWLLLAVGFGITSILLFMGSMAPKRNVKITWKIALFIGIAQILSLFRGVSRSGSTIATGLLLGLREREAIKFSYLLSIPLIFGANLVLAGNKPLPSELIWATFVAFGVSLIVMHFSFNYVLNDRKNLRWLGWYMLLLSCGVGTYALL